MSKRDFELIAAAIRDNDTACRIDGIRTESADRLAELLADRLARTNNRFDRARFLKACGVA